MIEPGYCECGCGQRTPIATCTRRRLGHVKGQPVRFCHGHARAGTGAIRYEVRDCGYTTPCWVWLGTIRPNGYGSLSHRSRKVGAHVHVYTLHRGPVPAGLDLDHLCRNRACVNPDHLEPVTRSVNCQRAAAANDGEPQRVARKARWEGHVSKRTCPRCGGPKEFRAKTCRSCATAEGRLGGTRHAA